MLEALSADSEQLSTIVAGVAELASHISGKVRTLDLSQSRVIQTLDKIKAILDRTDCMNGISSAMASEDYEAAANFIGTFIELEAKMADLSLNESPGQELAQRQIILDAQLKLEEVIARQLDDAVQKRDQGQVQRFAKMYKPLGKPSEGSKRFVEHLQLTVAAKARAGYSSLSEQLDSGKKVDFPAALSSLFKDMALALEEHEAFLQDSFGPNSLLEAASGRGSKHRGQLPMNPNAHDLT